MQEDYIQHRILFEFHKGSSATVATKNVWFVRVHYMFLNAKDGFLNSDPPMSISLAPIDQEYRQY